MASIKVMLNKSRIRADKTYPVVFQIICEREKKLIYPQCYLHEDDFDPLTGRVVRRRGRRSVCLNQIDECLLNAFSDLKNVILDLEKNRAPFTMIDIVDGYNFNDKQVGVLNYISSLVILFKKFSKDNTACSYTSTYNRLARYIDNDDEFSFLDMTPNWLRHFVDFLNSEGLRTSTIGFYLRVLSASYHRALVDELFEPTVKSPFANIMIPIQKTVKRAISSETIKTIAEVDLSSLPKLDYSRDLFMASFYSRGMSFIDIAKLKWVDIKDGNIVYARSKTGQIICVEIEEPLMTIFLKYKTDGEYVFPIIVSATKSPYTQYRSSLRRTNEGLDELTTLLKLSDKLTTYVARHSWATIAKQLGVSLTVISESLGHTSEMTTRIYLKEFDHSVLHRANALVCSSVLS